MAYCYTAMDSPAFFYAEGDCGEVNHDLKIVKGDLKTADINTVNGVISAVLIQLNTDKVYENERGWWGDEFQGFPIGTLAWTMQKMKTSDNYALRAEAYILDGLKPLIAQGLFDDIKVETVQVVGGVEATVDILKNGESLFRMVA